MTSADRQLAIVYAEIARMNCEVAGMIAENMYRQHRGEQIAYDEVSFCGVVKNFEHVIGYNAIVSIPID